MIRHTRFPGLRARFGVSRWDITPGLDVGVKNWGATDRWFASGVHRPLTGTALAISEGAEKSDPPLLLISLDLGWWRARADADQLRLALCEALELPEENLIVHLTHTHAAPLLDSEPPPESNPEATIAYLETLREACIAGAQAAVDDLQESTLLFHTGSCALVTHRDFPDPDDPKRFLTGFHPEGAADDTLVVARIFDDANRTRATLVNYACHPTTLAWDNDLVSPDFPGAMREVIESTTESPCLFLQGASGELAPCEQYLGDTSTADRHGRVLGHAAMSLLEMLAPGQGDVVFDGPLESGAPLALWKPETGELSQSISATAPAIDLPLKPDLPSLSEIRSQMAETPAGFAYERLVRQLRVRESVGDGTTSTERIWAWKLGAVSLVGVPFEAYSALQTELREQHPNCLVLNLTNGNHGYLPPAPLYHGRSLYTVWQTPYAEGSLEAVTELAKISLRPETSQKGVQ
ncbi:MAG: hypothetical protein QNL33_19545 [Akkermansiaceae bacterium]|jgi:hypothetical protein